MTRRCTGCGAEKLLSEFNKQPLGRYGREARCKACKHLAYLADAERKNAILRERYASDPEFRARKQRGNKAWNTVNAERIKLNSKTWQAANPERYAALHSAWRAANREQVNAAARKRRATNPEHIRAIHRRAEQVRRARKAAAWIGERVDAETCYRMHGGRCGICGEFIDLSAGEFHVDHVIPLSKGGQHAYANTQPAHPSCNKRKRDRLDFTLERSV